MSSSSWAVTEFLNSIPTRPSLFFFFVGEMRDTWYGSLLMFGVLLVDGHGFAIDPKRMKVLTSVKAPYFPRPESIIKPFYSYMESQNETANHLETIHHRVACLYRIRSL